MANDSPKFILSEARIKEFQKIYKEIYHSEITFEEASEMGRELINVYKTILNNLGKLDSDNKTSRLAS